MPRRPAMRSRTFKVSDQLWTAAMQTADEREEILAEEIRRFLEGYAAKRVSRAT